MGKITFKLLALTLLSIGVVFAVSSNSAQAQQVGSNFNASRIIDDSLFYNGNELTPAQIQQFLNARVPVCDTNGTKLHWSGQTRAQWAAANSRPLPPYICLKDFVASSTPAKSDSGLCTPIPAYTNRTAAQIIDDVARACNISQKVLLVTLEKEQSLLSDDWPWPVQYEKAMGYYCPDDPTRPGWCAPEYAGFFNQVYNAARQFQRYRQQPNSFNHAINRTSYVAFQANAPSCGGTNLTMQTAATAGLYNYTPYQPNQAALNNLYGTGDSCSAYGNRNFWRMYSDWFGNTITTVHNGIDYSPVFDAEYYLNRYADLRQAFGTNRTVAFSHFISTGMSEGRQAKESFNVNSYRNRYPDLRRMFGNDLRLYYTHYVLYGKNESRIATGDVFVAETLFNNRDYSSVYDFSYYQTKYPDVKKIFSNNDIQTIAHFVSNGMSEGRQAKENFNVNSYKDRYPDLRRAFGENLSLYYTHFMNSGSKEGRIATGAVFVGTSIFNGVNYGAVYNYDYYLDNNSDLRVALGNKNDIRAIQHFVNYGMREGRQASSNFNVVQYRNKYADLRAALGSDYSRYFWHYLYHGIAEGRTSQIE
jgi:hypothetical protein